MTKKFNELFDEVISLWPETLDTSEKKHHKNGGANIPILTSTHEKIERKIFALDQNDLLIQVDWAIYTVLHQLARNQDSIVPKDIDREAVCAIFERNVLLLPASL
ncbi:hypothetical protein [Undibacterium sp. Ji49W]|uniref:hypothetical protein n=1 Tax=Undibacterium sp. Ji49W TaxID=3413040 RepID=UPI003BEFC6C5